MSKGSKPRPFSVTQTEYDSRWDAIFGRDEPKCGNDCSKCACDSAVTDKLQDNVHKATATEFHRMELYQTDRDSSKLVA